ncbi:helix-turn-helix transcriptional regulator [Enterococcus saccharolyticus]|uniref:helix-turn-helix domain-containing protein n=1 Tax=Enterococcus saccharolyticus TaxID=41997 RepID=UPI001E571FDB|nr:helix-turn-helix transcriptional regulator [Enterococcus saccharolyticus]MCD5001317.1 helix-turn-helix transcriptional regulator [Enterococcus saccharolyticus]
MEHFGERMYRLRKEMGFSQEELAMHLGVTRQTISNWEHDLAQPTLDKAVEIATLFNVSLDELVGRKKSTRQTNELIQSLLDCLVTIYIYPETTTWISVSKTTLKSCKITEVNPTSIRIVRTERKQRIERLIYLKDIVGFKREEG